MNAATTLTQSQLVDFLMNVAVVRPVFIWGSPGIGKSALVQGFAETVGIPCVSLLGSQLAPEDLIGVPQIVDGKSRFCPPTTIARDEPYCLFLDELNACGHEVQKAFYSLIHERRIGEYNLPKGSIVIGAGNRSQDNAIVKPMSSALINRMIHVHLKVSHRDWLAWAMESNIHALVYEYIGQRPDHLWSQPPKHEETFSSPRAWHMLSDALHEYGTRVDERVIEMLAFGCLSPEHASQFRAFFKQIRNRFALADILKGERTWPNAPSERDLLYFLAQSFRAHLLKELPSERDTLSGAQSDLLFRAKALLKDLAAVSLEIAQMVVTDDAQRTLPSWFLVDVVRDLPRIVAKKEGSSVS
ncbi:MAG TPA: MoxR family ATPase [Candidatus Baltobacteraceae bacterium]|nr:MoxR family ATPase [Candidatus Baltobacteraceae bacterium]